MLAPIFRRTFQHFPVHAFGSTDNRRRRGRRWRWWTISLPNVFRNLALPGVHVPVGVANTVIPNNAVHTNVAGLRGTHPWASPRLPDTSRAVPNDLIRCFIVHALRVRLLGEPAQQR